MFNSFTKLNFQRIYTCIWYECILSKKEIQKPKLTSGLTTSIYFSPSNYNFINVAIHVQLLPFSNTSPQILARTTFPKSMRLKVIHKLCHIVVSKLCCIFVKLKLQINNVCTYVNLANEGRVNDMLRLLLASMRPQSVYFVHR